MRDLKYIHYDVIDSTHTEAKRLIAEGKIDSDTVISADMQTAGRGRSGKSFFSPADSGIYMTVVLKDMGKIEDQVTMTTRTAVAAARGICKVTGIYPDIKWVNDLYLNGRKIAGILCEAINDYEKDLLKFVVIGIGINLTTAQFPKDIADKAGSLFADADLNKSEALHNTSGSYNLSDIKEKLISEIAENIIKELRSKDAAITYDEYRKHSNVIGHKISFIVNNVETEAEAIDIDDVGGLVVKYIESGSGSVKQRVLNSGEISIIL